MKKIDSEGELMKDWRKIEYFVPFTETFKNNNEFVIRGVAINECVTRNGVSYKADELEMAAPSLRNKPVLKDHNNSVESIVGKTTENVHYDFNNKNIKFEAIIKDKKMQEMINEGLIGSVSIGAMVRDVTREEEGGPLVARGINFVEISLVAVPADPNAGFEKAIAESFNLKNAETMEAEVMEDEKAKAQLEEKARVLEEQNTALMTKLKEFEEKEMDALRDSYKALASEKGVSLKEGYEKLSREVLEVLIDTLKSIKVLEIKKEEKNETKGEVEVKEDVPEVQTFKIERSGKGIAFYEENLASKNVRYAR